MGYPVGAVERAMKVHEVIITSSQWAAHLAAGRGHPGPEPAQHPADALQVRAVGDRGSVRSALPDAVAEAGAGG